ncbi:gag-pol polyprotein [Tanacetum coccineum]
MSTQQDIYVAGSKNHPPMLNKDNYVPWSYRLLRYAKSKPNRKLIYNSIMHGSYVRRIIPEPGDPDREVPVAETFHEQTDEELTEKKKSGNGNGNGNNRNQIRCYNYRGMGHLARNCTVRPKRRDAASLQTQLLNAQKEEAGIQLQAEEFDLMTAARDLDKIEEVNANCILMANLQQALTSSTQTNKAPVYDSNGSAKTLNEEIANLNNQLSKEKSTVSYLQQEKKKFKTDFKTREYELLDKQIQLENKIKELDNILVKTSQSIQTTAHAFT